MNDIGKRARVLVAVAVSAGGLAFAGPADAAHGGNKHCGDTISGSVTLTADVVDASGNACAGNGLIMTSGATLDLDGYTIKGDVAANANSGFDEAGILFNGVNGAKVTDSAATQNAATSRWEHAGRSNQVTGFDAGVAIVGGYNNVVERVNVEGNVGTDGQWLGDGIHVRSSGGTSDYGSGGVQPGNLIKNNTVTGNGPYDGIGVLLDSDYNTLDGNVVKANAVANQDIGIRLEQDTAAPVSPATCTSSPRTTDNNNVVNNTVTGSTIDGISILGGRCDASNNEVGYNNVSANGLNGIRLNNLVKGTDVHHNTVCANAGAGIRTFTGATGNSIHDNTVGASVASITAVIACLPNNPIVLPPVSANPLAPPHGDLHDDQVLLAPCATAANIWQNNKHLTEFAGLGSTLATSPGPWVPDYECIA